VAQQYNGYGVIWDVDGTLVDTAQLHFDAWVKFGEYIGREFTQADFTATFGKRNPEIINDLYGPLSPERVAELGDLKETYYREEARHGVELLPGVRRLLEELHAAGYKQAIGSSGPHVNLDLIIELTNSRQYFEAIVGSEDTTRGKPDPQVFLVGAERLGLAPHKCLVMEDAIAGVEAAKAGGMACIGVTFVGHHSPEKLQAAGADLVVPSLERVTLADIEKILRG
jgi:beta-phosphoglucomutase